MKNKKKLIKKISAVLCAVVVAVSALGVSVPFYASSDLARIESIKTIIRSYGGNPNNYTFLEDYLYIVSVDNSGNFSVCVGVHKSDIYINIVCVKYNYGTHFNQNCCVYLGSPTRYTNNVSTSFNYHNPALNMIISCPTDFTIVGSNGNIVYSDFDVYYWNGKAEPFNVFDLFYKGNYGFGNVVYNSSLGYLQNVKRKVVFDDVPLGENVGETFTERWYYDSLSTTGIDLTSGEYLIRYYQEKWIVTGYGENDVVKKSDRYVLGDYIVQSGYIETYSESVDSTLAGQGYEEPGFLDLLWNKFVTTHYYFQIVDGENNEVGGLLHIYLTDENGKFGVEHIGETLDDNGNYDEGGYKDFIDEDSVTSDDVESGFEDMGSGENVDFGDLDGVDGFVLALELFAEQVSDVPYAVSSLFGSLPPWVPTLLGVAFVLLVVRIIFKVL